MKTIFECETEIGRCDSRLAEVEYDSSFPMECSLFAHTTAYINGSKHMVRIEQRCFLRLGDAIPGQPWIRPEIRLEPVLASEEETVAQLQHIHEQFVQKSRSQIPFASLEPSRHPPALG